MRERVFLVFVFNELVQQPCHRLLMFVVPFIYTFVIQLEQYHVSPLSLEKPDVLLPQALHSVD